MSYECYNIVLFLRMYKSKGKVVSVNFGCFSWRMQKTVGFQFMYDSNLFRYPQIPFLRSFWITLA